MELLEKILEKENLNKAYKQVKGNKGCAGIDGIKTEEIDEYIKENKTLILTRIRKRKYQPSPVLRKQIPKANGKKRNLGIPTVMDRIIQQAIVQVLSPIYEEQFHDNSFGFRPGRCCEQAVIKILEYLNDGYDWIVDIDLERFFDTVNQDKLINIIRRTIEDGDVVSLIAKYLKCGVLEDGLVKPTNEGTPQGGNLSPLLSNIMLNELDKELAKRNLNFTRYADDCVILVKSEKAANRVMESITKFIEKKLGLKVNMEKTKVTRPGQTKYLGFSFYKVGAKYYPKPHIKSIQSLKDKIRKRTIRKDNKLLDIRLKELKELIVGWVNYYKIANMKSQMQEIDRMIRRRIRVIILKQWKKPKTIIKNLQRLGIDKEQAKGLAWCGKGLQYMAKSCVVQRAISNERLMKRGLTSMLVQYQKVHI
ncbi:MAG: group II intron reverse transcriptase/maturase [Clostridia bacterium]|nr:group II intron reverse transcriptase/maturase [Clostridia bacterium]